jgi:hypothetical protein
VSTDLRPALHAEGLEAARVALVRNAAGRHALYPQYDGYFDDWTLFVIIRDTRFKSGCKLHRGDIVLAAPDVVLDPGIPGYRRAYDPITGHVVGVPHENIVRLGIFQ